MILLLAQSHSVHACFNLEQNDKWSGNYGCIGSVPCLPSHFMIWSLREGRLMLAKEALLVQGIPVYDVGDCPALFETPWLDVFDKFSEAKKKDLVGNTIHLEVIGSILAWVLGNAVPVSQLGQGCAGSEVPHDVLLPVYPSYPAIDLGPESSSTESEVSDLEAAIPTEASELRRSGLSGPPDPDDGQTEAQSKRRRLCRPRTV